jgi:hypothetical protein
MQKLIIFNPLYLNNLTNIVENFKYFLTLFQD